MPKRKRGSDVALDVDPVAAQRARVERQIFKEKRELQHAVKLAKGFERAKLQRRLKQAQNNGNEVDVSKINAEISAWKKIDNATCAETHLYKALLKTKAIAQHHALPDTVRVERQELDTPTANVIARLYNAAPTKKAMEHALSSIRTIMRVGDVAPKGWKRNDEMSKDELQTKASSALSEEEFRGFSEDDDGINHRQRHEHHRLGGSEDARSDEQEEAISFLNDRIATSPSEDENISDVPSDSSFPIRRATAASASGSSSAGRIAKKVESRLRTEPSIPHFVPSLQVGYISGSESSATDVDADIAPRKNRRGQRARQAIWEKKYGAGAKHLTQPSRETRDMGWDLKRGATAQGDGPPWKRKLLKTGPPGVDGVNAAPVRQPRVLGHGTLEKSKGKMTSEKEGPLHPSWVAKQKAREKQMQMSQFQGKRITFD